MGFRRQEDKLQCLWLPDAEVPVSLLYLSCCGLSALVLAWIFVTSCRAVHHVGALHSRIHSVLFPCPHWESSHCIFLQFVKVEVIFFYLNFKEQTLFLKSSFRFQGFPGSSDVKESACNVGFRFNQDNFRTKRKGHFLFFFNFYLWLSLVSSCFITMNDSLVGCNICSVEILCSLPWFTLWHCF